MITLAQPSSDMLMRDPLYKPRPVQQMPQEKSAAQQMTDMATNKAMTSAVDKGASLMNENVIAPAGEALTGMFSNVAPAATGATIGSTGLGTAAVLPEVAAAAAPTAAAGTGAAAAGGMAALGTAIPYIGMGLLAGKAFGLFNNGGFVGGPLSSVTYKVNGGKVSEEVKMTYGGPLTTKG